MTAATALPLLTLPAAPAGPLPDADLERRFAGLARLYGRAGYARLRTLRLAVVGLGGVGSWVVEALARSGVAALALIDFDQVAESNVHRQVQALGSTLGLAKAEALRQRIADIHPGCTVAVVEAFVEAGNWPGLLPWAVDGVVDACDDGRAKQQLAAWARATGVPLVCVGAAGGKQQPQAVEVADLAAVTHDPLLATLRQRLRRDGAPRQGAIGVRCVFSREPVALPLRAEARAGDAGEAGADAAEAGSPADTACATDGSLNCAGYGSTVTVTATFGMVAAGELLRQLLPGAGR